MALIGRLHPLLIHFPIALVIVAVVAEGVALVTEKDWWRTFAVGNLRTGAAFALIAALAGWRLVGNAGPRYDVAARMASMAGDARCRRDGRRSTRGV